MTALPTDTTVAVVGAGTMGAGIAQVAAQAGHPVLLYDATEGAVDNGIARLTQGLEKLVQRGRMSSDERDALLARIRPAEVLEALAPAGLVIEAIVEDLEIKQGVFGKLENLCGDDAILVGMHFFNPAPIMKLVEVVSGAATGRGVAETVHATAAAWGKSPVHARSSPGFIVNRVARPFYAESLRALEADAADVATIDALIKECGGFRMGPFELMDLIGNDVNFAVTRSVYEGYYHDPRFKPSLLQRELVAAGHLGRKSGRGYYDYSENAAAPAPAKADPAPAPKRVTVYGELGVAGSLVTMIKEADIDISVEDGPGIIRCGDARLALSDGRHATTRCAEDGIKNLIAFDLAADYRAATRIAMAPADQASSDALRDAAGLFQALGKQVSIMDDYPGLMVMRTVCMLANEAADAVDQGVCNAGDVDTAMQRGVNYPKGPLAWADDIGMATVLNVTDHLAATYGEDRYRASPWLRRKAAAGRRATI